MSLTPQVLSSPIEAVEIEAAFSFTGLHHLHPTWKPRYSISSCMNSHFSNLTRVLHSSQVRRNCSTKRK